MNKKQLEYVMDALGYKGKKRNAMFDMIFHKESGYAVERQGLVPKGTAVRECKRCIAKWEELKRIAEEVAELLFENLDSVGDTAFVDPVLIV